MTGGEPPKVPGSKPIKPNDADGSDDIVCPLCGFRSGRVDFDRKAWGNVILHHNGGSWWADICRHCADKMKKWME